MSRSFFALIALYRNDCHLLNVYDPPHCFLWFALSRKCKIYIYITTMSGVFFVLLYTDSWMQVPAYLHPEHYFWCSALHFILEKAVWSTWLVLTESMFKPFQATNCCRGGGGPSKLILPIKCRGQKFPLAKLSLRRPCKTWGMAIRWWRFGASKLPQGPDNVLSTLLWISYKLYQSPA